MSRKRLSSESTAGDDSTLDTLPEHRFKRQRQDDVAKLTPVIMSSAFYMTPPRSAPPSSGKPTVSLALRIPEHVPDLKERRELGARKGAAKRWMPKLQNPFPGNKEIKKAYSLKLMRHYPAALEPASLQSLGTSATAPTTSSSSSTSSFASAIQVADADFVKPVIQKSARMTKLLKTFPALSIPPAACNPMTAQKFATREQGDLINLRDNRLATVSREVVKLAWKDFARPDDNPRKEVMLESALPQEELRKERRGIANDLPEWKKWRTSKFLAGDRTGKVKMEG
jgi:hypothetical protein